MNPHQQNKVDINSLAPEEQRLFRLYGKLPTKKDVLQNKLKERKYFDSGDYALSKAGKPTGDGVNTVVGTRHPDPANIPHSKEAHVNTPLPGSKDQDQLPGSFCGHPPSTGFHRKSSLSESADSEEEGEGETKAKEKKDEVSLESEEEGEGETKAKEKKDEVSLESEGQTNEERKEEVNLSLNHEEVPIPR